VQGTVNVPSNTTETRPINYVLNIDKAWYSGKSLKINVAVDDANINDFNFIQVNFKSVGSEEIYGMGLQYTVWNFKGLKVPVISSEGGVGRGL
jgi:hypothetical protein